MKKTDKTGKFQTRKKIVFPILLAFIVFVYIKSDEYSREEFDVFVSIFDTDNVSKSIHETFLIIPEYINWAKNKNMDLKTFIIKFSEKYFGQKINIPIFSKNIMISKTFLNWSNIFLTKRTASHILNILSKFQTYSVSTTKKFFLNIWKILIGKKEQEGWLNIYETAKTYLFGRPENQLEKYYMIMDNTVRDIIDILPDV